MSVVWSGSALFVQYCRLILVSTVSTSLSSDLGLNYLHMPVIRYWPALSEQVCRLTWVCAICTFIVWSGSALFVLVFRLILLFAVWTRLSSDLGLNYVHRSVVRSGFALFVQVCRLILVGTVCTCILSDLGLHCLNRYVIWYGSALFAQVSRLIWLCTLCTGLSSALDNQYLYRSVVRCETAIPAHICPLIGVCTVFTPEESIYFSYLFIKTYGVGTHWKSFGEALPMSTHTICLHIFSYFSMKT